VLGGRRPERRDRNVLGGNFALVGLPSVGASGAIFGTVGVLWVDLLAHWGIEKQPGRKVCLTPFDRSMPSS
jgi:hypothetical protein